MLRKLAILAALAGAIAATPAQATEFGTGCYGGVHGALTELAFDLGPAHLGVDGQAAGVSVGCDNVNGAVLLGAYSDVQKYWGDIETMGLNWSWSAGARAGVLPAKNVLIYGAAQYTRLQVTGSESLDAWGAGAGIEAKINKLMSVDLRYMHLFVDDGSMGGAVDVSSDMVRLGLNFRLDEMFKPAAAAKPLK